MKYSFEDAKQRYYRAKLKHDPYRAECKKSRLQYNEGLTGTPKDPLMIYNFTKELVNSQISGALPMPMVTPCRKTPRNVHRARVITAMLRAEMDRMQSEELNDIAERITRIMGGCLMLVEWDSTKKSHNITGDVTTQVISPLDFVPQEGITKFDNMDYWFITLEDTKDRIAKRYNKDPDELGSVEPDSEADADIDLTTQVIMMYRNDSGGIGYMTWAGEVLLQDEKDYLVRKDKICAECGRPQADGQKKCDCGSKKWESRDREGETLTIPLTLMDGTVIQPFELENQDGRKVTPESDGMGGAFVPGEIVMKPRKVPYYKIDVSPAVMRLNTTDDTRLFGSSDCEDIRRLQTGSNIATSKIAEKQAVSGYIFTKPTDMAFDLTNQMGKVLNIESPDQMGMLKQIAFEFNAQQDFLVTQNAYQWAKSILGVTDTFQGKADPNAVSGVSKELLIRQAQGVQRAKEILKEVAFARYYEVLFKMHLAFTDEERPYTGEAEDGSEENLTFNRYDFLEYDQTTGQLYYEDDFIFSVDQTGTSEHDKGYMMKQIQEDYSIGAYGQPGTPEALLLLWKEREGVSYPGAGRMVQHWTQKLNEQQQMMQQQMGGIPPGGMNGLPQM